MNRLLQGLAACLVLSSVLAYWQAHRAPMTSAATGAVPAASAPRQAGIPAGALGVGGLTQWQFLGPNNVGGPTSFVGFRPDEANVLYSVTHGGDVFRSDNAGSAWSFKGNVPLRGAKLEFVSGEAQILYAYADDFRLATQGDHVVPMFKSTDGGQTWTEVRPQQSSQWLWLEQVHSLRTIAGQPGVLWATTTYGLLRSTDDGASWSQVYTQGWGTKCSDIEISLVRSRVYTACSTPGWNVIAAHLDGSSWSQLTQRSGTQWYNARLAMAKSNTDVMYLVTFGNGLQYSNSNYLRSITRTTDGGATWEIRYDRSQNADIVSAAIPGDFEVECQAPDNDAQTIGRTGVMVDPANSAYLWISGFEIYRSSDGGTSFGRVRARAEQADEPALGIYQGLSGNYRYTSLAFPSNYNGSTVQTLVAGGRTGIERTDAARAAAQTASNASCSALDTEPGMAWSAINNGYSATRLVHGEMLANGETVVSGPDMDVGVSDGSGPDSWARITPLKGYVVGQVSMDPTLGTDRFIVSWPFGVVNWSWDSAQSKWGANSQSFVNGYAQGYVMPLEDEVYMTSNYPHIARDPKNRLRLAAVSPNGVFQSTDNGSNWTLISPSTAVAAVGFKRDGSLIAATDDGYILAQLGPNAQQWEKRTLGGCVVLEGNANSCGGVSAHFSEFALSANPADNGIYATAQGQYEAKVWYSANGSTWQPLDKPAQPGGLPLYIDSSSTTLAIDADNPRYLYAGTPMGLFASEDNGANWTEVDNPFPGTPVARLQFLKDASKGTRKLVAFTYGRGAWVANVAASTTFGDVPTYYWAHDFIQKLYTAGITGGCTSSPLRYCPTQTVLRDQMAVFLLRAKHGKTYQPPAASGDFSDVATSYWAAAWIERLRDEGITGGCGTNPLRYCPTNSVRREEIAVFLLRAKHGASYQPPAATGMYADVPTNYWAAAWIEQLSREGIGGGCTTTPKNFCPTSPVTRDQMAAFLVRAFAL